MVQVGKGDSSFSTCLARALGSAHNMVATSLKSQGSLRTTYRNCLSHLSELKRRGYLVLLSVEATLPSYEEETLISAIAGT
ncbi:hypothetical protein PRUPE_6G197000 [Prunus persica]|uniref:25S rRNA (uridine-N(3))-methyltransferase BMT5-like domain-containing protein n=1 Tax=Prunus persica TaxID=3760 RepID=M5WP44_PRUPE|nr:hypothetical protein PRUPE_6G197000 [Prunus persica]